MDIPLSGELMHRGAAANVLRRIRAKNQTNNLTIRKVPKPDDPINPERFIVVRVVPDVMECVR